MFSLKIEPKKDCHYRVYLYIDKLKLLDSEVKLDNSLTFEQSIEIIWKATAEARKKILSNYEVFAQKTPIPTCPPTRQASRDQLTSTTG